jgi:hypothetical protein
VRNPSGRIEVRRAASRRQLVASVRAEAGVSHPFLDAVEIAVVRDQRIVDFLFRLARFGSNFGGSRRMLMFYDP